MEKERQQAYHAALKILFVQMCYLLPESQRDFSNLAWLKTLIYNSSKEIVNNILTHYEAIVQSAVDLSIKDLKEDYEEQVILTKVLREENCKLMEENKKLREKENV